jgi:hypothetical protein
VNSCRYSIALAIAVALSACVATPVSTTTSSDLVAYRAQMEEPDWLSSRSHAEVSRMVDEAIATPIEFFGRVVGPDGQPIKDATVTFAVFDTKLDPFEFPYVGWTLLPEVKSGGDGHFRLTGVTGTGVYVRVSKPGWKAVGNSKRHIRYAEVVRYLNQHPVPTKEEPMDFHMAPGMPLEDYFLIHSGSVLIPRDGSEIEYSLAEINPYGVPAGQGDLGVACQKGIEVADGRWDWSCTVRMTGGGGIQYQRSVVLEQAPADGYRQSLEIGMAADDPAWDHRADRYTYVRLGDGDYYGHLTFRIRTAGDFYFDIDGMVNVTGSRELETLYSVSD